MLGLLIDLEVVPVACLYAGGRRNQADVLLHTGFKEPIDHRSRLRKVVAAPGRD